MVLLLLNSFILLHFIWLVEFNNHAFFFFNSLNFKMVNWLTGKKKNDDIVRKRQTHLFLPPTKPNLIKGRKLIVYIIKIIELTGIVQLKSIVSFERFTHYIFFSFNLVFVFRSWSQSNYWLQMFLWKKQPEMHL